MVKTSLSHFQRAEICFSLELIASRCCLILEHYSFSFHRQFVSARMLAITNLCMVEGGEGGLLFVSVYFNQFHSFCFVLFHDPLDQDW